MSADKTRRLGALHSTDADTAEQLLFALSDSNSPSQKDVRAAIDDAVIALEESIEAALVEGVAEVMVPLDLLERLAVALKRRTLSAGRRRLSRAERVRNEATVGLAWSLTRRNRELGMKAGEAKEAAAKEAAAIAGQYGATLAWTTILSRMKRATKKPRV